jgi:predicted nucleic acid-binding Zn ribbon protein
VPGQRLFPLRKIRYTRSELGALVRCWSCDTAFRPWDDERVCSRECGRQLRRARARPGRACVTCGTPIHPRRRVDARFCSSKCYQRAFRYVANKRNFESVRELVADDMRELKEAWRWAEKANPSGYAETPQADRLRDDMRRVDALLDRRDYRSCEHCGTRVAMRRGQRYCSTRCRVAAHRHAAHVR